MNSRFYILFYSFFFHGFLSYAQSDVQKTLERADKHILDAERYYAEMNYTKAKESYQFAARLFRNNNLPAYYAICYNGIGNIYIDISLYEEAKNKGFDKTLQQLSEIKSIDPSFDVDSSLVADAYEGLGRYYSSISSTVKTAKGYVTKIHYDLALDYHQKALNIRQKLYGDRHPKVAQSYYFMARCHRGFFISNNNQNSKNNPIQTELDYLEKALKMFIITIGDEKHQTANTYEALGDFYYEIKKDHHTGFDYHQKALQIRQKLFDGNHPQIASSYINLAIYYRVMNMFDEELSYLEKALKIQLTILGNEHEEIAQSYYLLAKRYQRAGELEKALAHYGYALDIFRKVKHEQSIEVGTSYLGLALCYRDLKQTRLEFEQLKKSEKIHEKIFGKKHFKMATIYMELGAYYQQKSRYDSTLYYYNLAVNINQQQLGEKHYSVADTYDKLASVYTLIGDENQELHYLTLSLELKKDATYLNKDSNTPKPLQAQDANLTFNLQEKEEDKTLAQQLYKSYMNLAVFYKREQKYPLALEFVQRALAAVCPSISKNKIDIYSNPSTEDLSRNIQWLNALEEKGNLLRLLYEIETKSEDLDFAISTYDHAIKVINSLRTNFTSDGARQELTKHSLPIYEGAITVLYIIYNNTQDRKHLHRAFKIAEQSKSFVLLQALQNTRARGNSNIPNDLLAREKELRRKLAYYSNYKNRGIKDNQKFDMVYFQIKQSYDSLITMLEANYPTYYDLKYKTKVNSIKDIEEHILDENKLVLEYFIGNKYLYVFKLSKDQKEFFQILIPNNYERLVDNLRSALTNYSMVISHPKWAFQAFVTASHDFYTQFLAPFIQHLPPHITKLTIIPDGMLNYIPFEVLISELPEEEVKNNTDYKSLSFLLKKYQINYSYSSTLLISNLTKSTPINNGQCLAFAPSTTRHASDSLPWTQKELEAIKNIYPGQYYLGKDANKSKFKELAQNFSIIHLAMHGVVNMRYPMRSLLAFAGEADSVNSEKTALFAYEIHNLSLQANLVVLSACETGFGKTERGEGVLSLARAFLFAGAPSVVTTLWEVNDFTSAALVETFYSNLSSGMSKPLALQQAKLTFLSKTDEISGHPTYWGSFITIGSYKPIKKPWPWCFWIGPGIGLLLIVALILRFIKTKKDKTQAPLTPTQQPQHSSIEEMESIQDIALLLQFAQEKITDKAFDTARKSLERVLALDPFHKTALMTIARLLAQHYNDEKILAADFYRKAIMMNDENEVLFYEYGCFLMDNLEAYHKAILSFEEAIELKPSFDKAYLALAQCQKELGKTALAQTNYSKACALNPALKTDENNRIFGL